jgi:hypothetical protein
MEIPVYKSNYQDLDSYTLLSNNRYCSSSDKLSRLDSDSLDETFCSNFVCCGVSLPDLHALLKHYEDFHIRFAKDDIPTDHVTTSGKKARRVMSIEPCDFTTLPGGDEDAVTVSAFDTTVVRTIHPALTSNPLPAFPRKHHHRSQSAPATSSLSQSSLIQSIICNAAAVAVATVKTSPRPREAPRDRPYICPVHGCGKAYKNPNGLKYHTMHGHDGTEIIVDRPYKCPVAGCDKQYKNPNGLKYHLAHVHHLARQAGQLLPMT